MSVNNQRSNQDQGGAQAPSETNKNANAPQNPEKKAQPKEGDIRKVESVSSNRSDSRESFGDDYEVKQEEEITREEASTENENNTSKSRRS